MRKLSWAILNLLRGGANGPALEDFEARGEFCAEELPRMPEAFGDGATERMPDDALPPPLPPLADVPPPLPPLAVLSLMVGSSAREVENRCFALPVLHVLK